MKTLYLHIGTPKTATSSIQKFLEDNREVLQKHGYSYPPSLHTYAGVNARRNGHFLVGKVLDAQGKRDKAKENAYLEEGIQQVRREFETYENVVLSDESLWFCLSYFKPHALRDLKKEADAQHYQIKVIVYLRRQDTFLLSRWNQGIKSIRAAKESCDDYFVMSKNKERKIYQYATKLDEIAAIVGKENVTVRRFVPGTWRDGSIIHDFMHEIGLDVTPEFVELEESVNFRLDKNATEIKRVMNQADEFTSKEVAYMGKFLKQISRDYIQKDQTEMLSKEELEQFLETCADENRRVAEEYIGDGNPLFNEQVKDLPKWSVKNDLMQEEMILFFSKVMIDLHRTNEEQAKQIKELQKQVEQTEKQMQKMDKSFTGLKEKIKHPFRTIWHRIFR